MNFKEAEKLAYKTRWKIGTCNSGEKCWCRTIEPEKTIEYFIYNKDMPPDKHEFYIIGDASVDKKLANYIVKLHNKNLKDKQ